MASIQPAPSGGFRAFVSVLGYRDSKVLPSKRDARSWASRRELELRDLATKPKAKNFTLLQGLRKYSEEVSAGKKGKRWEQVRLSAFENYFLPLDKVLGDVTSDDVELFRDSRLKSVSGASVRREISLLSAVFTAAKLDWKWGNENPCRDIRLPKGNPHRRRTIKWWEIKKLLRELGYAPGKRVASTYQAVGVCFMLALRTGMRAGELCSLTWDNVFESHCFLPDTKNGTSREVPLSRAARRNIEQLRGWDDKTVCGLASASLDAIYRRMRRRAGLEGFTFHDARHTAATILASKLNVTELCAMFGWKDPAMAMVYVNPSAQDLALKLG